MDISNPGILDKSVTPAKTNFPVTDSGLFAAHTISNPGNLELIGTVVLPSAGQYIITAKMGGQSTVTGKVEMVLQMGTTTILDVSFYIVANNSAANEGSVIVEVPAGSETLSLYAVGANTNTAIATVGISEQATYIRAIQIGG